MVAAIGDWFGSAAPRREDQLLVHAGCLDHDGGQRPDEIVLARITVGAAESIVQEMEVIDQKRFVSLKSLEQHTGVGFFERKRILILHDGKKVDGGQNWRVWKSCFMQLVQHRGLAESRAAPDHRNAP